MTDNWTDEERDNYFAPGEESPDDNPPYTDQQEDEYSSQAEYSLFDAPDYALFIRHKRTERGKEYEQKVASILKAGALASFKRGRVNDGCTLLHYGPAFARKCGDLTDVSQGAAKAIDLLTTPDNPWFMFGSIALPFAMQLFRNHEAEAAIVNKTWRERRAERKRMKAEGLTRPKRDGRPVRIKLPFGRAITVNVKLPTPAVITGLFYAQTRDPRQLTNKVLSDPRLIKALEKEGIQLIVKRNPADG